MPHTNEVLDLSRNNADREDLASWGAILREIAVLETKLAKFREKPEEDALRETLASKRRQIYR